MTDDEAGALMCAMLEKAGGRMTLSGDELRAGLVAIRTRLRTQLTDDGVLMWLEPATASTEETR